MPNKLTKEEKWDLLKKASDSIKAGTNASTMTARSIDGKEYSSTNQCFLANQGASDGVFGGFQQWKKISRTVKKGEHGFCIVFPMIHAKKEGQKEESRHFAMVSVFHFDQTEPSVPGVLPPGDEDADPTNALEAGALTE